MNDYSNDPSWDDAVEDWLCELKTRVAPSTVQNYHDRLRMLRRWTDAQGAGIALADFRGRHLTKYLALRVDSGVKDVTRRHDAIACRQFLKWCARNGYLPADPLAGYAIPKAAEAFVKCPSEAEVRQLLTAIQARWKPAGNPAARFVYEPGRAFYSRRNYAIVAGLVETACRAGEMLALRLEDYDREQKQIAIRQSKGGAPRILPISVAWISAVDAYLKKRPKCDSPLLFVNVFGEAIPTHVFGKQFRGYMEFAGLSGFTMHGLRHYALTRLAQTNLMAAAHIAGHKDLKTTRGYLHASADFVRSVHAEAGMLTRILVNTRSEKARRKKLI